MAVPPPEHVPATRLERALLLLGPLAVVLAVWWVLGLFTGRTIANEALAAGGIFLTFIGPSVIFGPAVVGTDAFAHLTTWDLVGVTGFFSLATAFFYSFNLDLIERLPRVGPALHRGRESMRRTLAAKPWIRRWAIFGVGFFVILPLPGSGTLGGSIMGRLAGLSRTASFLAVGLGGVVVCLLYGWGGESFRRFADEHRLGLPVKIAVAALFLTVLALIGRWLARQGRASEPPAASPPGRPSS